MLKNDLHVHSVKSPCGIHTILEIVEIAARKGIKTVNISDHGSASTEHRMAFGILCDHRRSPLYYPSLHFPGNEIKVLAGIEGNILGDGGTDIQKFMVHKFDLVSAGFHSAAKELAKKRDKAENTRVLNAFLSRYPIDILTHPCDKKFPLDVGQLVELAVKHGFALEVNNTKLRFGKENVTELKAMIKTALALGAKLVANSDGHTFMEIGEDEGIDGLLKEMGLKWDIFVNFNDLWLDSFLESRKQVRKDWHDTAGKA